MISDTGASFIVLQKQFANIVWIFLPTIIIFKLLLTSVTIEGGQGLFNLIKGCFYSIIILAIFNYFYPEVIGIVDGYIQIEPVAYKETTGWSKFWVFTVDYSIGLLAVIAHTTSISLLIILLTIVTTSFSISYALYAIFGFDGLWKITVKCTLAVILWTGTMYFIRSDVSVVNGVTDENAASYFSNVLGAAVLSILTSFLAFKYNSIINKASEISDNYNQRLEYESLKRQAESDIREGRITTDEQTGQMVRKSDYSDPVGEVFRAHKSQMLKENPEIAKKHGLKPSQWQNFEDDLKEENSKEKIGYSSLTQSSERFREQANTSSPSNEEPIANKPEKVSLPKGLNPYKMNPSHAGVRYEPIKNSKQQTTGYDVKADFDKSFSVEGSKFIKNNEGNYYSPGTSEKLAGIDTLKVNGKSYERNPKSKHNYFNLINEENNEHKDTESEEGVSL